ncbi:hypothetical protein [Streptomyces boluensis]|uniref:Uncharacterized protein n=1 Tax=Streptomyces boluensis TaxID=1775135 RepID=A0A964UQ70_9ACTN|nr:hypothetical protein [Streptomyces boluensis]NBE52486.1 hypothetical protein [Streptomyces boluensis]
MGQPLILGRGARLVGRGACAVVALVSVGWIVRDVVAVGGPGQVWWMWAGVPSAGDAGQGVGASGPTDLTLALVCSVAASTAASAPSVLVAAGVLTVALRLPSLWILTSDWTRLWADEGLRTLALTGAAVSVAGGVVMLGAAVVGRRAPGHGAAAVRPVAVFLLLGATACVRAAWEVNRFREYGWEVYRGALVGSRNNVLSLLHTPAAWQALTFVAFASVAAVAALRRRGSARPLGLAAATVAVLWGALGLSAAVKGGLYRDLGSLPLNAQLSLASSLWYVMAGALLLVLLARRGTDAAPPG